ncbi:hypothetical protein EDB87DRAFT_607524 [Lactarius vividus]|nr:hypothetical protein EDB87DRAFT_607524 [Lactarius vividus]
MSLLTFVLFYVLVFVQAVPLVKRIVVSPQITSPSASTTWNVGDKVTVTWETSSIPPPGNFTGQLLLGFLTLEGENLDVDHPLAQDFSLSTGSVQITVPNVPVRTNYIVVLFGDSGNASPQFTITGGSSTTTTLSPSPTATTPSLPPTHPLSPIPTTSPTTSPPPLSSPASLPPVTPTDTSTPGTFTATSPISSPSSSTSTPSSATSATNAPSNSPSTSSNGTTNSALPALRAHGARAISLCAAAAAMSLVLVL